MTTRTILIYRIDKTYGGSDYIEISPEHGVYTTGNTRSHQGNGPVGVSIEVSRKKNLDDVQRKLLDCGFTRFPTLYGLAKENVDPKYKAKLRDTFTLVLMRENARPPYDFISVNLMENEYHIGSSDSSARFGHNPAYLDISTLKAFKSTVQNLSYHYDNVGTISTYEAYAAKASDYTYINKVLKENNTNQRVGKERNLVVAYTMKTVARLLGHQTKGKSDEEIDRLIKVPHVLYDNSIGGTYNYYVILN